MSHNISNTPASPLPRRCIFNDADMEAFSNSSAKAELLHFVEAMGKSCSSHHAPEDIQAFDPAQPLQGLSPSMACLHGSLQGMLAWVDEIPPSTTENIRFGNPAFRLWHARLVERSEGILRAILETRDCKDDDVVTVEEAAHRGLQATKEKTEDNQETPKDASIAQVSCYLHDSFGHATRLDYGTGHESSFLVLLLILSKVKCLGKEEAPSIATLRATTLSIFTQYLKLTRRLQTDYRLEPAGSHGVWGLDDYHCLPFYFGACQLHAAASASPTSSLRLETDLLTNPTCVSDESILKDYGDRYLYLSCIRYIRELKRGVPFFESSPMLFDISQTLPSWDRVARGMLRLYQGEVLSKRVVVQHFVFSKYFPADWTPSQDGPAAAPTETFRSSPPGQVQQSSAVPMGRAPWAIADGPTKAPWATTKTPAATTPPINGANADTNFDPMQPTKAPWAK